MELLFLEHTYRWLVTGGVLMFVVPENRLTTCIPLLAANFTSFRLFRLDDPESRRFNQVVLTAVRKPLRGQLMEANRSTLQRLVFSQPYLRLEDEQEPYILPPSAATAVTYRGLPLDQIESDIIHSPTWKQIAPFLLPKEEMDRMATTLPEITATASTLPLSPDSIERFGELAEKHGWSLDEAMRRALDITNIVLDAKDEDPDSKVYVYRGGKRYSLELQK